MKKALLIIGLFSLLAGCTKNDLELAEKQVAVRGITLSRSELTIIREDTRQVFASVTPGNATNPLVTWCSDDPSVAAVDAQGNITAGEVDVESTTRITATTAEGNYSASCQITVKPYGIVVKDPLGVTIDAFVLPFGDPPRTYNFTWHVYAPGTIGQQTEWTSAETTIVEVDDQGAVRPLLQGNTLITITSTIRPQVSVTLPVEITYVPVAQIIFADKDKKMLFPVNVMDTEEETQKGLSNFYTWGSQKLALSDPRVEQDRHLFLQMERPALTREIVLSFDPAIPSVTAIDWEYKEAKNSDWVALGDGDQTGKPLQRPVPKLDTGGNQVFTPEGNPVFLLTIPKGGDILPKDGWAAWDPYDPAKQAYVTLRATSADPAIAEPDDRVYAECKVEVYDYGRSMSRIVAGTTSTAGSLARVVSDKTIDATKGINWNNYLLKLWVKIDNAWQPVEVYYTAANTAIAGPSLKVGEVYEFRYEVPEYTMPYVQFAVITGGAILNKNVWNPNIPIAQQNPGYADICGFQEGTFYMWPKTSASTYRTIALRTTVLIGNAAGNEELPERYYKDATIFPWYQASKNGTTDWCRFNVMFVN